MKIDSENKLYQTTFFISSLLNQEQIDNLIKKFKQLIDDNNGAVLAEDEAKTNNLIQKIAYPIKKQINAFYFNFNFLLDSQSIDKINHWMRMEKNILRHMIVAKEKPKSIPKEIIDYKATEKIEAFSKEKDKKPKQEQDQIVLDELIAPKEEKFKEKELKEESKASEKVKIEDLDQKLEEILNQ